MKSSASEPDLKYSLAGTESFFSLKSEAQPQEVGGQKGVPVSGFRNMKG